MKHQLDDPSIGIQHDPEVAPLFTLLDDPDERIAVPVMERLRSRGAALLPSLLEFASLTSSLLARDRALSLAREANVELLLRSFKRLDEDLLRNDPEALERGAILIAKFGDPSLDPNKVRAELSHLTELAADRIGHLSDPFDVLNELNEFFFKEQHFRGNEKRFIEPENSYIDQVLERRTGIPISLAVVYLLVTQRLRLPFHGASTPGHFLVRYDGSREPIFVDAFNAGVLLRKRDIQRFLESSGFVFNESFILPSPPRGILLRMMRNLIIVFKETNDEQSLRDFRKLMRVLAPGGDEMLGPDEA